VEHNRRCGMIGWTDGLNHSKCNT